MPVSETPLLLAPASGSSRQFVIATLPLLLVLLYFIISAARRPFLPLYQLDVASATDDEYRQAEDATGPTIRITDMLYVFLAIYALWCCFAMYLFVFVPRRRHLIGRYLRDGTTTVGNVLVDEDARNCGRLQDYGHAVYGHPLQPGKMIRKRVRVFQNYTRETVGIVLLPDCPKSGQPKVDLELDLQSASAERDTHHPAMARTCIFWLVFTALGPLFLIFQMNKLHDEDDLVGPAVKIYLISLVAGPAGAYLLNLGRWIMHVRWLTNRGAVVDSNDGRDGILAVASTDGTELPAFDYGGDGMSYQGSLREAKKANMERDKNIRLGTIGAHKDESESSWTEVEDEP